MTKVFVYGTLKSGYGNNVLLKDAKLVGTAKTIAPMLMFDSGFPVAILPQRPWHAQAAQIKGEVYEVNEETLKRLDRLEGEGRMYNRHLTDVRMDCCGGRLECEMYVGNWNYWRHYDLPSYDPIEETHDWSRFERSLS